MIFMCFMNVLNKPWLNGYSSGEGTMCILVYWKKNRTFRLREGTGLSMEKIHHHVLQFVDSTKIFGDRVSVRCSEKCANKNICGKHRSVRLSFNCFPIKSIRSAARELELSLTTQHKILHKRLRLYAYKVQMLHRLRGVETPGGWGGYIPPNNLNMVYICIPPIIWLWCALSVGLHLSFLSSLVHWAFCSLLMLKLPLKLFLPGQQVSLILINSTYCLQFHFLQLALSWK